MLRFFCRCDCAERKKALLETTDRVESLERKYTELNALYLRLQGRYAREQRTDVDHRADTESIPNGFRGNPRAVELLEKGRR